MVTKKILIVDDEELVLKVLEKLFLSAGYTPICASDGQSAIRLMEEHQIRVIFTDLRMPGMDGMAVCRRAKTLHADSIVYAISAYVYAYRPEDFEKAGFAGQFEKPFDTGAMLEACERAFARLSPAEEASPAPIDTKHISHNVVLDERLLVSIVGSQKDPGLAGKTLIFVGSTVSKNAIQLRAEQEIEPGTDLLIYVGILGQSKPCLLSGMVKWCQPAEGDETEGRSVDVGIELLDSSRDFDSWCAFLYELH